ncbi:xanthine/CO dehydrogenase XdhC/CoxF family maturation factor [Arthrobacter woluwensis]|nr:xanthine/CO dehydrogenase XdhC/CoxF family maturation factor [Arthrobacter woluwensis]
MLELGRHFDGWAPARDGEDLVVATIVATSGSTPRPAGTSMLVAAGGGILGSLSGGCVEGAVVAAAQEVLACGRARRERFGYSAEDAFAVGLTCGGELEIHLSRLSEPERMALASAPVALLRRLDDDGAPAVTLAAPSSGAGIAREAWVGLLGLGAAPEPIQEELLARARTQVEPLLRQGRSGLVRVAPPEGCHDGEAGTRPLELFVESRLPAPRAVVVGANDFSEALLPVLKLLGFHVTLCDARPGFVSQTRFAPADAVERTWPHRYLERQAEEGLLDERSVLFVLSPRSQVRRPSAAHRAASGPGLCRGPRVAAQRPAAPRVPRGPGTGIWSPGPAAFTHRTGPRRRHPGGGRGVDRRGAGGRPARRARHGGFPLAGERPPASLTTSLTSSPGRALTAGTSERPCHRRRDGATKHRSGAGASQ